jgi:hypothetical protein
VAIPGSTLGWHLIERYDLNPAAQHIAEWADLLKCEIPPVIEDATAASRVFGK